jgi:hypothetical protein
MMMKKRKSKKQRMYVKKMGQRVINQKGTGSWTTLRIKFPCLKEFLRVIWVYQ